MALDMSDFDRFFEENGYEDGQQAQAFADFLAGISGHRVVGMSEDGVVQGDPPE